MAPRAKPRTLLCVALSILLLAGIMAALSIPAARAATAVSVSIHNYAFNPSTISISPGDTVTWTNNDLIPHTVTSDSGLFNSMEIAPGGSFSFTFTSTGTFGYHCMIHTYMAGTVTVGAVSSTTTSSTTSSTTTSTAMSTSSTTPSATTTSTYTTTNSYSASSSLTTAVQSGSVTSTTIGPTTTPITSSATPSSSATSNGGGGIPEFPFQAVTVVIATIVLVVSYLAARGSLRARSTGA